MILPSDKVYKETKQIMLGKKFIKTEFQPLADWIDQTYGVKTINIYYDTIDKGKRPRLEICFEHPKESILFRESNGFNFDSNKQKAIAKKFEEIINKLEVKKAKGLFSLFKKRSANKYKTKNLWVIYSDFKSVAETESNLNIPKAIITKLINEFNNKDIWDISRYSSSTTIFLYTDDQKRKYLNSEEHKKWAAKYYELLSQYDEFGYFKKEFFNVLLDSKENFDKNYESNWYYYYN